MKNIVVRFSTIAFLVFVCIGSSKTSKTSGSGLALQKTDQGEQKGHGENKKTDDRKKGDKEVVDEFRSVYRAYLEKKKEKEGSNGNIEELVQKKVNEFRNADRPMRVKMREEFENKLKEYQK